MSLRWVEPRSLLQAVIVRRGRAMCMSPIKTRSDRAIVVGANVPARLPSAEAGCRRPRPTASQTMRDRSSAGSDSAADRKVIDRSHRGPTLRLPEPRQAGPCR